MALQRPALWHGVSCHGVNISCWVHVLQGLHCCSMQQVHRVAASSGQCKVLWNDFCCWGMTTARHGHHTHAIAVQSDCLPSEPCTCVASHMSLVFETATFLLLVQSFWLLLFQQMHAD